MNIQRIRVEGSCRRAGTVLFVLFSIAVMSCLPQARAQKTPGDEGVFEMTKAQKAQLLQLMASLDEKINAGFKGQEKLRDAMTTELKAISATKDPEQRKKAAGAYQRKYNTAYSEVLARSKVDPNAVAGQLHAIFPQFLFRVENLAILGTTSAPAAAAPARSPVGAKTEKIPSSEFETDKDRSCGAIAGGDVTSTNDSIEATAFAAVAGGCGSGGTMSASVDLPRGSTSVSVEADLGAEGFAVGVVGTASAIADAGLWITCGVDTSSPASASARVSIYALAPFFWVASAEEELDGASRDVDVPAWISECDVYATSDAQVVSIIGESHSRGTVDRFEANVTIEQ